jgi:hypothetical protein
MPFTKSGTLIINASSADGALPTEGVTVKIIGVDEENRDVQYSILTDIDGISKIITLPAPPRELSLSPGAREQSYANYDIEVTSPGFYTKRIHNVAVFDGERSIIPINMIPRNVRQSGITYPRGNLSTTVRENEMLE